MRNMSARGCVLTLENGAIPTYVLSLCLGILFSCLPLFSQGNAGRILGSITDQTGGAISGASVTVTDTQRGVSRTLVTDDSGAYVAPNLIPGTYSVSAEAMGFKTSVHSGLTLEVNQELRIDLTLQPGEQTEKITVTGELPLIETTNATLGGTLQNATINELPLNGRNFQNLLSLRPGVLKYPGGAGWTSSTNGVRPHDQMYLVDGVNSNDPWMAQSIMNAVGAAGDAGTILPIDAIQEFRTEENPRAEYGWKPGAVVSIGLKSGTNSMHGTGFAFGRDGGWDALNYFSTTGQNKGIAQPAAPVELEQFGGSFGGPVKKDKIFYFLNFEGQRYYLGNPATHNVPITAGAATAVANDGSLTGQCKQALAAGKLTALSAQLAGLSTSCTPLANYPGLFPANSTGLINSSNTVFTNNAIYSGIGKVDYHVNDKHTLIGSYFISPGDGTFADAPTTEIAEPWLTVQHFRAQVGSAGWTWTPSSNWVNDLRVGYSHYYQTFVTPDHSINPADYTYNGATYNLYTGQTNPLYYGLPQITISGYSMVLGGSWPKTVGPDSVLSIMDHVSILRGNHAFMFGGEILQNQSTNNVTSNTKGPVTFSESAPKDSLTDFFEGSLNAASFTAGNLFRQMSSTNFALFLQDDWRVRPRVTVNLGVRYEVDGVIHEANGLLGNFDPVKGLTQVGAGISSPYNGDHNNFSPRLGIAWDVQGNGKTVVRVGGGIIYEQGSFDEFNAVGNLIGLRTVPTGVPLLTSTGGVENPVTTAGGNISVGPLTFQGAGLAAVSSAWANNSPTNTLYFNEPACGDGKATSLIPGTAVVAQPCSIMGVARNLRVPYVSNWTLDVQRAITNNLSLDVAYVGNHGTKLLGLYDLNQAPVGAGYAAPSTAIPGDTILQACEASPTKTNCTPSSSAIAAARPFATQFPYLSFIEWLSNLDSSNYNGLQTTLTERTSHGLSFVAGYTYSHSLDMCPDNWRCQVPLDKSNLSSLYGNSQFDLRNRFTLSTTYALPGKKSPGQLLQGWSLNSILTLMGRMPWDVSDTTFDFAGNGERQTTQTVGDHWDFFGNPSDFSTTKALLSATNGKGGGAGLPFYAGLNSTATPTSNTSCNARAAAIGPAATAALAVFGCYAVGNSVLIPPAFGTVGTNGRDVFRGPTFNNWDLSITKEWVFRERLKAQFRAETFNILNHPDIGNPGGGPGGGGNTYTSPENSSFGSRPQTPDVINSNPVLGAGGSRAIQLGLKLIF